MEYTGKTLREMSNDEITDLLIYKVNGQHIEEIEQVAEHVWHRLEDKINKEVSLYMDTIGSHKEIPGMRSIYRTMRNEIIEENHIPKGDFTKHFAYCRGRK